MSNKFLRILILFLIMMIFFLVLACKSVNPDLYTSPDIPLNRKVELVSAGVSKNTSGEIILYTGEYRILLDDEKLIISTENASGALILRPLGEEMNLLRFVHSVEVLDADEYCGLQIYGSAEWTDFSMELLLYKYNPGLISYKVKLSPLAELPSFSITPEWDFVDATTLEASSIGYLSYANRAPGGAPSFYGYAEKMDSTLLYWTDLTGLNNFTDTVHYSSASTPLRRAYSFGHNIGWNDIRRLPLEESCVIYDSYLYLAPNEPLTENALFTRYLGQVSDIYDLIAKPEGLLPNWQDLAEETMEDLGDPDTFVTLDGQRYWRAYVGDSRQSAEAISQLDIGLALARYKDRFGGSPQLDLLIEDSLSAIEDFYNPQFGLIQNSGPLQLSGNQGRGDTWYELGHVLKAAEWGLLGYQRAADLAQKSSASWMDYAQSVDYRFPQFYLFNDWQGTGREPDASGGYALYMIRLADLSKDSGEKKGYMQEAMKAVRSFPGYGFDFSYETHMTAAAALAAAELAVRSGDDSWLEYSYGPIANLIRLSWLYEVDYGFGKDVSTFFGLNPTQRSDAITPKEQYESWIYLREYLRLVHSRIDPSVEKLISEFCYHSLVTMAYSLPPLVPDGIITANPAAYETVGENRLDLYIPIEDMRNGWDIWGSIGQEVYGAGMAPSFAALAYTEIFTGITVYGGYPMAKIDNSNLSYTSVTFTGVSGTFFPVFVEGCTRILNNEGVPIGLENPGQLSLFMAEGGAVYEFYHL